MRCRHCLRRLRVTLLSPAGIRATLGEIGDPRAVLPLIRALDDNQELRWSITEALGALRNAHTIEPLAAALNDPQNSRMVREGAIRALAAFKDPAAARHLAGRAHNGEAAAVRFLCTVALGATKDPQAMQALPRLLRNADPLVREGAVWGLGRCGLAGAGRELHSIIRNRTERRAIRCAAAVGLGALKDEVAVNQFCDAVNDESESTEVRQGMIAGLGLSGESAALHGSWPP